MVVIRLRRAGAKKRPFYHIVVADQRKPLGGRFIAKLGYYNPMARGQEQRLVLDLEKVKYWVGHGAQPSQRVKTLMAEAVVGAAAAA